MVLENWVFGELWKALPTGAELNFWRSTSNAEVDFVVTSGGTLVGVEVKAAELGRPGITRSARSFVDAYAPTAFLVVNRGIEARQDLGRTAVRWIRPHQLASSLADGDAAGPGRPGRGPVQPVDRLAGDFGEGRDVAAVEEHVLLVRLGGAEQAEERPLALSSGTRSRGARSP